MSKLANLWMDLFRAGDYSDKGKGSFTDQDVQQVVDNYDPAHHEAPAVIGHPQNDAPAYGWFTELRRVGDLLQGKLGDDVDPKFEDAVTTGRFKKRSVSLYKTAKGWSLRHVGFLGAMPPEVKGLANIPFAQEDKDAVEIEFSEETYMAMDEKDQQSLVDKFLAGLKGLSPFQQTTPSAAAPAFDEAKAKELVQAAVSAAVTPLQEQIQGYETKFSDSQTAAQAAEANTRCANAIASLKAAGKWVPAFDVIGVPHMFAELAKVTTQVEFGEGSAAKKQTPLEIAVAFMEAQPKIVPTGRQVDPAAAAAAGTKREYGAGTDANSIQFNELVEKCEKEQKVTFAEASRIVAAEHPELLAPAGNATAGAV